MRYAVIENETVVNIALSDDAEFAAEQGWIEADEAQIGWIYDGEFVAPPEQPEPVPIAVTPLQMRRALRLAGLKSGIEIFLSEAGDEAQEAWEYAVEIRRDDQLVNMAATALGKSQDELDELFRLAATMT